MGMIDAKFDFGKGQALTGTSDVLSTNVYDAGSAKKLFGGSGARPARIGITQTATGGTSPTLRARLVAADNAALTTNPIILADTGVSRVLVAGDVPRVMQLIPQDQIDAKQFYGIIYTQGGTSPTATVSAALMADVHDNLK